MSFDVVRVEQVTVVAIPRELELGNRDGLKRVVGARLEAGDRKFVLDFERTRFLDSSGLGTLVTLAGEIREAGGELRLAGLSEPIRTLFALTRLDGLFRLSRSRAAAVGEL